MKTYEPLSWKEPSPNNAMIGSSNGGVSCYWEGEEVTRDQWDKLLSERMESNRIARSEKEFTAADEAFAYAASLRDGVVLDWGRKSFIRQLRLTVGRADSFGTRWVRSLSPQR